MELDNILIFVFILYLHKRMLPKFLASGSDFRGIIHGLGNEVSELFVKNVVEDFLLCLTVDYFAKRFERVLVHLCSEYHFKQCHSNTQHIILHRCLLLKELFDLAIFMNLSLSINVFDANVTNLYLSIVGINVD